MYHDKKGLLEGIFDSTDLIQHCIHGFINLLWSRQGAINTLPNVDRVLAYAAFICRIGQQVFCQSAVQIHKGEAVETNLLNVLHQQLNGRLVVQDHLGFQARLARGHCTVLDQFAGIESRVGVPFQMA